MTHKELKEMVIILKENAFKSHNDTAILNVKVENFKFVMDKVLEVLDRQEVTEIINKYIGESEK